MKTIVGLIGLVILLNASECSKKEIALANTRWKILEFRQPNATSAQLPTKDYILEFQNENSLNIRLDVNNCMGSYEITGKGAIRISPLGCTKMCCDSEFAMNLAMTLSQMHTLKLKKNKLTLTGEGRILLELLE